MTSYQVTLYNRDGEIIRCDPFTDWDIAAANFTKKTRTLEEGQEVELTSAGSRVINKHHGTVVMRDGELALEVVRGNEVYYKAFDESIVHSGVQNETTIN